MVMGRSSQTIAGDGVQHGAGKKTEANDYEKNVEHGGLIFRARTGLTDRPRRIKVRYAMTG
jgi:hypothetical protein